MYKGHHPKGPQEGSKAIVRLYRPCNTYTFSFHTKKLNPYVVSDTRGSGSLYNTKKARYFLIELDNNADLLLTQKNFFNVYINNIDLTRDHQRIFNSSSKRLNLSYLIGTYLTFTFAINRQFSPETVKKYFKCLRQLLMDKMLAIKNRLLSDSTKNRQTKTYIRFSAGSHVIYLGFYLPCGTNYRDNHEYCDQPAAFVLSQNQWKCNDHLCPITVVLFNEQLTEKFPNNPILFNNKKKFKPRKKDVHSTRLGLKYEVTIRKYNDNVGNRDKQLKDVMEPITSITKKGIPMTRLYYKKYRNLEFDIIRSPHQIKRWNRLKQSIIKSETYSSRTKPYILKENSEKFQNSVVFKQLCHSVERGSVPPAYNHLSIMEKSNLRRTKNWLRRVKKRNKLKKTLPPLPPDFIGDVHQYYYKTYHINLFDYKIRR